MTTLAFGVLVNYLALVVVFEPIVRANQRAIEVGVRGAGAAYGILISAIVAGVLAYGNYTFGLNIFAVLWGIAAVARLIGIFLY